MQEIDYRHQLEEILNEYNISYCLNENELKTEKEKILFLHNVIKNSDIDFANLKNRQNEKKVLCIEPNVAHDSMLPSFYKYFQDLGYSVDFLLTEDFGQKRWNFFTNNIQKPQYILIKNMATVNAFMSLKCLLEYDVVMLNTDVIWNKDILYLDNVVRYLDYLKNQFGIVPKTRCNILQLIIHIYGVSKNEKKIMLKKKQFLNGTPVFSLIGYKGIPMFSPQYFGDIKITAKNKDICNFITLGCNVKEQHNYDLMISAVNELINNNITNFHVTSCSYLDIPEHLKEFITIKVLQPPELFEEIEKADFILPLYDSSIPFTRNTFGKGTGSTLNFFSFGFLKPMVIENIFAKAFRLKGYLGYASPNNLYQGMIKAIEMEQEEYKSLQMLIKNDADYRYNKTLKDIKTVIENNKRNKYKVIKEDSFIINSIILSKLQNLFSVKNKGNHKVWRILGIKMKFRRKNK